MQSLKQKWIDVLPVIWGIISLIILLGLIITGILLLKNYAETPDIRTPKEILENRYKICIDIIEIDNLSKCNKYIEQINEKINQ